MNDRFLIINADDAGLHPGIDAGILDAARAGTVTSASLFVNGPYAFDIGAFLDSGVSLGLHFNLTIGYPCSNPPPSSLTDKKGVFFPDGHGQAGSFNEDDIRREIKAQFKRFREIVGSAPSHLDAHKHLHRRNNTIFGIMMEMAGEYRIPLRCPTDKMRQRCRVSGVATSDRFIGGVDPAPYWTVERVKNELADLPAGITEMMCHPGRRTGPIEGLRYVAEREAEREAFLSGETKKLLEGIRLTNFRNAPFGAGTPT